MMMPRIFGENLFDDFMNDFAFPDFTDNANIEKALYGKHAKNLMKTDVKDTENGYEVDIELQEGRDYHEAGERYTDRERSERS